MLAVGINHYDDPEFSQLKWAASDAIAFFNYFASTVSTNAFQGRLLLNKKATKKTFQEACDWLNSAEADDTIIVFLATHGSREIEAGSTKAGSFIIFGDSDYGDIPNTGLSFSSLAELFRSNTRSQNIAIILDCCFSGSDATPDVRGVLGPNLRLAEKINKSNPLTFIERTDGDIIDLGEGHVIISACAEDEIAKELDSLKHGAFTYSLLEYMNGLSEPQVSIATVYSKVCDKVASLTMDQQSPVLYGRLKAQRWPVKSNA